MYLEENFKNLIIQKPLFYQWSTGLRFEIGQQAEKAESIKTYVANAHDRAVELFEQCFSEDDSILIIYQYESDDKKLTQDNSFFLSQITNLSRFEIIQEEIGDLYTDDFEHDSWTRITINRLNRQIMNYRNILLAFINAGLNLTPRTRGECYFINTSSNLILNLYGDQGMDIIARRARQLKPLYDDYNEWLMPGDRDKMKLLFAND